jgi:hypothetical protein
MSHTGAINRVPSNGFLFPNVLPNVLNKTY